MSLRPCRKCRRLPLESNNGKTLRCPACGLTITATGTRSVKEIWDGANTVHRLRFSDHYLNPSEIARRKKGGPLA